MKNNNTKRSSQSLTHRLDAIQIALGKFVDNEPDAHAAIRQLATSILGLAQGSGSIAIAQNAAEVLRAPHASLENAVDTLLSTMRKALTTTPSSGTILIVGGAPDRNECLIGRLSTLSRRVVCTWTGAQAREILQTDEVNFIILNLLLPDMDGKVFLAELRDSPLTATIPLLVVDEISAGDWIRNNGGVVGADGYIAVPIVADVVTEHAKSLIRIAQHSLDGPHRDPLTGLLNRAALRESYKQILNGCIEAGEPLSLMVLTITNDELLAYASPRWDDVMQQTGLALSRVMRSTDLIALWGSNEFAILLPGTDLETARKVADKVSKLISRENARIENNIPLKVQVYAGVAAVRCDDIFDTAMDRVDKCVFAAQAQGGGVVSDHRDLSAPARRVLLVHEQRTSYVLKQLLTNMGAEVVTLESVPVDFQASLSMKRFHLVVIDEQLHGGGLDILAALRSARKYDRVPVLMLLARNSEANVLKAIELGASDYLTSPFPPTVFVSRVKRLLFRKVPSVERMAGICDVLIADDEATTLIMAATALYQHGGFAIRLAKGSEDAMTRFRAGRPGVVILDPLMKLKDNGKLLLEAILTECDHGETACIATMSADCPAKDVNEIVSRVKGIIQKPLIPCCWRVK